MDQNVIRTDLLPETMALWIVAVLAALGVAAWAVCHWAVKRYGSNRFNVWYRALMSIPLGTIASWLVLQTLAKMMFLATPWSLFLGAAVAAFSIEAVSAFYGHECARVPPKTARILVACRMGAVALALFVLMQPVIIGERERTVKERVLVLVDDSSSMHFKDRQMTEEEAKDVARALGMDELPEGGMTRAEVIRLLLAKGGDDAFLAKVGEKYEVDVFRFGNGLVRDESIGIEKELTAKEEMFRSVTDITKALELAVKEIPAEEITSVILFTDGRHNGDAGVIEEREFTVEGDEWSQEFRFIDVPKEQGVYSYSFSVAKLEGELFDGNNTRQLDVAVSDDRTNVLLVDGRPRWEYRYLRNLFYGRDKSVHLQDWLVHPDSIAGIQPKLLEYASASRPFGESEAGGWPIQDNDWRQFDVIIVGDIGEDVLTEDVVEQLRYNVEERGALLVLVCGSEYMPYSIRNRKLRDLMPIEYTPSAQSRRDAPEDGFSLQLAAAGRGHTVMNQSSSSSENEEIWQGIPDFHWRLPVDGIKPGAEVLAFAKPRKADAGSDPSVLAQSIAATIEEDPEAALKRLEEMRGEQNRNALIVAAARGKGKVLMLTTDSMWRLRSKDGDHLHHRFWGQVMRWGAGEKLRSGNMYVRIGTDQLRYGAGETVKVYARFLDEKHNGIDGLDPRILMRTASMGNRSAAFFPVKKPDSNGIYECEITGCVEPGEYTLSLDCPKASAMLGGKRFPSNLSTSFVVVTTKQPAEEVDITATRDHVDRIAAATGGRVMTPSEYVKLKADFGGGSKRIADRVEFQLWSLPPLFILIVLLLTVEWVLRKRASLS